MKTIELPINDLKLALSGFAKVTSRRSNLPVLASLRINRDPTGAVTLQATDLESFATYKLPVAQPGEPVEFLVPIEPLAKAAKGTKDRVCLYQEDKDSVIIQTKVSNTPLEQKIATLEIKQWPEAPTPPKPGITVDENFRDTFRQATECASHDESRYILNGVYLDVADKKAHYVVSTNGRVLFSANSFAFNLKDSLLVPTRKFLDWSGFWTEGNADLAIIPGEKAAQPNTVDKPGWLQFTAGPWTFITKQIEGNYPNWKQVVPNGGANTTIRIPDDALKAMEEVIARIPGDYEPDHPITLHATRSGLVVQGKDLNQKEPACIPVPAAIVQGDDVSIALNRYYLEKGLRFGLTEIQIVDELSPLVLKAGGKRMVIMPLRLNGHAPTPAKSQPASSPTTAPEPVTTSTQPTTEAPASANDERTQMTKASIPGTTNPVSTSDAEGSPMKKALQQIENIKEELKKVLGQFNEVLSGLRQAERDKKASEKEIEQVREKLREIQSVRI